VAVPHTPGPVLFGIRGETANAVESVAEGVLDADGDATEPSAGGTTFLTNQGTDAHLRQAAIGDVREDRAYRVDGMVVADPETRTGGHVHFAIADVPAGPAPPTGDYDRATLPCVAFEPTKRFRDRARSLRVGDRVTVCGEVSEGTCKLEKFALREAVETERVNPRCPDCDRRMESGGAGQGYRCRSCDRSRDERAERAVDRTLEPGWYEVPPLARRHVAKPLVRGGFDAPVHPER